MVSTHLKAQAVYTKHVPSWSRFVVCVSEIVPGSEPLGQTATMTCILGHDEIFLLLDGLEVKCCRVQRLQAATNSVKVVLSFAAIRSSL